MSRKIQFPEPISSVIARVMEMVRKQQSFSEQQKPRKQKQHG